MKRQTRNLILNIATGIALAATAAVVLVPSIASAAPATTTSNVNVRSGPGPDFGVVDNLRAGTPVDVGECRGSWCSISTGGSDGWVSASFLDRGGRGGGVIGPVGPSFGITIGPNGVQINPGNDQRPGLGPNRFPDRPGDGRPGRRPPVVEPSSGEACFYDRSRFRGGNFCMNEGESIRRLGDWADRISSIDNPDGLEVRVCYQRNFRDCRVYTTSAGSLGDYDDAIQSVEVR
jgi:uncharacterized protein YraI